MATTTNYGWAEPDNTSLVKNGAQDIRILGDAIDTSVWNIGFGQAGKNKIINGDFGIWQRGTSITTTGVGYFFGADRWMLYSPASNTSTMSRQTFTPGTAPVAGYESAYFARFNCTNSFGTYFQQYIEDVRTFAGQTVTLSFWAKAGSAISLSGNLGQQFGSGGSSFVDTAVSAVSVTTSWQRFSITVAVPSISGKTVGTSSYLKWTLYTSSFNVNIDIWGTQVEYGSKATPFQTASGGSPQAELAMCQRYYWRTANLNQRFGLSFVYNGTTAYGTISYPVTMRTSSIALETTGTAGNYGVFAGASTFQNTSVPALDISTTTNMSIGFTNAGTMTAGQAGFMSTHAGAVAYLGFNGEL
jgi:hypothetical protein